MPDEVSHFKFKMFKMIGRGVIGRRWFCAQPRACRRSSSMEDMCMTPYVEDGWDVRDFQKICGSRVDVLEHVREFIVRHPKATVHVGSDSKKRGDKIVYAVAIVLRIPERGGHVIFSKRAQPNHKQRNEDSVFLRLNNEVKQSIEAAEALLDVVDHNKLSVHVDLSSRTQNLSHKIHSMAMGWVGALSLTAFSKPDSWAASAVAHRFCQNW